MLGGGLLPDAFRRDLGRRLGFGESNADTDMQASLFSSLTYSSGGFVPARFLRDHTDHVTSIAYSSGGRYLAASGADHRIVVWDGTSGAKLKELPGDTETLAFSPDGTLLVSGTPTGEIVFWQVDSWTMLGDPLPADQHRLQMTRLAFSRYGSRLASASRDGTVAIWDPASRQRLGVLGNDPGKPTTDGGYTAEIWGLAFSPNDSETLVTGSRDDWVRIWNLRDLSQHSIDIHQYNGWVRSVVFAPFGKHGPEKRIGFGSTESPDVAHADEDLALLPQRGDGVLRAL